MIVNFKKERLYQVSFNKRWFNHLLPISTILEIKNNADKATFYQKRLEQKLKALIKQSR